MDKNITSNTYFIIDFDSTFVKVEALDKLAEIVLENNPKGEQVLSKIHKITVQGMNGEIPFDKSLAKRLQFFSADKHHIEKLIKILKKNITPSVLRNKAFFQKNKNFIYIISGGFRDYIVPLFKPFGIDDSHILANTFIFDRKGRITGFDKNNLLAQKNGKIKEIKKLNIKGKVYVIGDGFTDYEIKKAGLADKFFVFHENVKRDKVADKADYLLPNFDEFLYHLDLPRAYSYPKHRIKIILLENIHQNAFDVFTKEGYQVESFPKSFDEEELIQKLRDVQVVGIGSRTQITKKVVECSPKLLSVARFGIGVNNIDLKACAMGGVAVFNAPFSNTRSVVELALGEIIMLYRRIFEKSDKLHEGIWDKSAKNCHELRGKKLGIVGYGNIGSQLSVLSEMLGMEVYFYDIVEKLPLGKAQVCDSLGKLLRIADVISIHVDGRKENTNLIGEREFKLMKDGVIFVNTSRGFIVDLEALAENIKSGKVLGTALDVFPKEPKSNEEKFISIMQGLPNVILTPHIGGRSEEAQAHMGAFVPEKVINFINTGNTTLSVNFPNLQLPELKNAHRLIHIHRNVPGVLAKINNILADNKINIEGQYLKTNEEIGYVITDINKFYDKKVINELKNIEETIKFRVLY